MLKIKNKLILIILLLVYLSVGLSAESLCLREAIEEAHSNNLEILTAKEEIRAVRAKIAESVLPDNPVLFTEYSEIPKNSGSISDFGGRKIGISQEIELPFNYYFKTKKQHLELQKSQAKFQQLQNNITNRVKKIYFKILMLNTQKILYDDIVEITGNLYQKAQIRVAAGETSRYDVLKVKVDMAEAQNQVMALDREIDLTHSRLHQLLGNENHDKCKIDKILQYISVDYNPDSLKMLALQYHPGLQEIRLRISQKKIEKNLSWAEILPAMELQYFKQEFPGNGQKPTWGTEFSLSLPLWGLNKNRSQINSAKHKLLAENWHFQHVKKHVTSEVEAVVTRLAIATAQVENYIDNALIEVDELVRIATRSYEEGESGYLEVAEALRSMYQIRIGYSNALYNYYASQADLEEAVGKLIFTFKQF